MDCQAPLSMGFSRQEHWSALLCPLPGDILDPEIEPMSLKPPALPSGFFTTRATCEAQTLGYPTSKYEKLLKSLDKLMYLFPGAKSFGK